MALHAGTHIDFITHCLGVTCRQLARCIGVSDDFILHATMATIALFCAISLPVGVPILSSASTSKTCEHAMGQSPGSSSMWLVYSGLVGLALGGAVALLMLLFLIGQIVHDHFNAQF
jgi:hypothetical protein